MTKAKSKVPGPWRWSPFGSLPEVQRHPLGTFLRARELFGDVVKFRTAIWHSYLLCHPDDIKSVLLDNNQNFRKGMIYEYLKPVLGLGLLTNEGESWLSQRRLVQPAFERQHLGGLAETMTLAAERLLNRWHDRTERGPVDVAAEMARLTMDIVGQALLGSDLDATASQVREAVRICQEHVDWRITHLFSLPERYPTPRNRRFHRAMRTLDSAVFSIIERRREASIGSANAAGHSDHDLLTLLLEARDDETGDGMTDGQLRDEVMTIFLAGHETTANALAWAWNLLSLHPGIEERLHAEVDSVLGGRVPCVEDISQLNYTRMIIDETLRLYPPVWAIARFPVSTDEAGGYRIPAYSQVILSPYVTHRHPDFWEKPGGFDPERFLPNRIAQRPKYAYFPLRRRPQDVRRQ